MYEIPLSRGFPGWAAEVTPAGGEARTRVRHPRGSFGEGSCNLCRGSIPSSLDGLRDLFRNRVFPPRRSLTRRRTGDLSRPYAIGRWTNCSRILVKDMATYRERKIRHDDTKTTKRNPNKAKHSPPAPSLSGQYGSRCFHRPQTKAHTTAYRSRSPAGNRLSPYAGSCLRITGPAGQRPRCCVASGARSVGGDIEIRIKQRLLAVLCACQRRIRSRLTTVLPGTVISVAKPPPPLVFRNFAPKTRLLGRLREEKKGRPDLFFSRNDLLCHELNLYTARQGIRGQHDTELKCNKLRPAYIAVYEQIHKGSDIARSSPLLCSGEKRKSGCGSNVISNSYFFLPPPHYLISSPPHLPPDSISLCSFVPPSPPLNFSFQFSSLSLSLGLLMFLCASTPPSSQPKQDDGVLSKEASQFRLVMPGATNFACLI
ncbi:hypothetical protein C7M84_005717 [Penaeus vannamei]|uniref:Uncharacterized protein n=1 Tax=Penaeus vannamei TaxID=6689 RepID=A0A3R7PSL5_PENVA|nr:hypothetical protein C7M84_005717 [Penaeus vannamei]